MTKVLWIDDDINTGALRAYVEEFEDNGLNIVKVASPDAFLDSLKANDFDFLIIDIMMPRGESLSSEEVAGGMRTGLALMKNHLDKSKYPSTVIFTILNDEIVKDWAQKEGIPYILKTAETPSTFLNYIQNKN